MSTSGKRHGLREWHIVFASSTESCDLNLLKHLSTVPKASDVSLDTSAAARDSAVADSVEDLNQTDFNCSVTVDAEEAPRLQDKGLKLPGRIQETGVAAAVRLFGQAHHLELFHELVHAAGLKLDGEVLKIGEELLCRI